MHAQFLHTTAKKRSDRVENVMKVQANARNALLLTFSSQLGLHAIDLHRFSDLITRHTLQHVAVSATYFCFDFISFLFPHICVRVHHSVDQIGSPVGDSSRNTTTRLLRSAVRLLVLLFRQTQAHSNPNVLAASKVVMASLRQPDLCILLTDAVRLGRLDEPLVGFCLDLLAYMLAEHSPQLVQMWRKDGERVV